MKIKTNLQGGKTVFSIYLGASILSYLYVTVTGTWSGDFIGREVLLTNGILLIVLFLNIGLSYYAYRIFKYYAKDELANRSCHYNLNAFRNITWLLLVLNIILLALGFGVLGTGGTRLSISPVAIFRSLIIKLNPTFWATVYILSTDKKTNLKITYFLCFINSVLAHSLGGLFILFILLIYKYRFIYPFVKRHLLLSIAVLLIVPTLVTTAYNFRGQLRGTGNMAETNNADIFLGKFCARISSFSNSGYIMENMPLIITHSDQIPPMFYLYDPLHFWGFHPEFKSTGSYVDEKLKRSKDPNSSTMAGPTGVLTISLTKSISVFIINLLYMFVSIPVLFWLLRKMQLKNYAGIGLFTSLAFSQSGDSSEIAGRIYALLFMWFIITIFCRRHVRNKLYLPVS